MTIRFLLDTHYLEKRTDEAFWKPRIELSLASQGVTGKSLKMVVSDGTNVVFAYGPTSFLKVYTPFFRGRESLGMEQASLRAILRQDPTFPAPKVEATGELVGESSDWKWPYVILSKVEGKSAEFAFTDFEEEQRKTFAFEAGRLCNRLHATAVNQELAEQYRRNFAGGFLEFLTRQRDQLALSNSFAAFPLADEVRALDLTEFVPTWPCLVHGDISLEHVYISEAGLSLVDFGDAKLADPVWEFVTITLGLLGRQPELLREFVKGYGGQSELFDNFHKKIAVYALLHEWSGFYDEQQPVDDESNPFNWLIQSGARSLEELGQWYWPS